MKRISILFLFMIVCVRTSDAQVGDGCHVYVIDIAVAEKVAKSGIECTEESKCGVTTYPEFKPKLGEEELTTKTYKFPKTNLLITANVYFTDELLASASGADSVLLSITVAPKVLKGVMSDENSAVAESSFGRNTDAIRVKRFYRIVGKSYLVGMQCHFMKLKSESD